MLKKIKGFLLENRTLKQTIIKNAFWLSIGQIASRFIRAIIIIYAARILGAEDYGVFSYALSLSAFFVIFADLGINAILTREIAKGNKSAEFFSTIFFIKLTLVIIGALLIIFISPLIANIKNVIPLIPIIALLFVFDTLRDAGIAVARGLEKMQIEAGVSIFTNVAVVILGFAALLISSTPYSLAVGYMIGTGTGLILIILILKNDLRKATTGPSKNQIIKILKTAWPFALLGFLGAIMLNTDMLMLGWLKTAKEVGLYAAAQRPIQFLYTAPLLVASSLFPILSRLAHQKDFKGLRVIFEKAITALLLAAIPIAAGGLILAPEIINFIYGSEYSPAILSFQILILTVIIIFPSTLIGNAIFAYDQQKSFINYFILGALSNAIFNIILIPPYGISGAAIASIIAQILSNGLIWRKMKQINYFQILPRLYKIFIACFLMILATLTIKLTGVNFILNIFTSAILYLAILYYLKEEIFFEIKKVFR